MPPMDLSPKQLPLPKGWPHAAPCAAPQTPIDGRPAVRLNLHVTFYEGRRHLPIVELRPAV